MHPVLLLKNTGNGDDVYHMLSFRSTHMELKIQKMEKLKCVVLESLFIGQSRSS